MPNIATPNTVTITPTIVIYIDADACPVKGEVYRVAERHGINVIVVSNTPIAVPPEPFITRAVVPAGMDKADDFIAERAAPGAIVITADVPLAARAVKAGAIAIAPNGKPFTDDLGRHGVGDAQPHGPPALRRCGHRRAEAVLATGSLGVPAKPRPRDRPAQAPVSCPVEKLQDKCRAGSVPPAPLAVLARTQCFRLSGTLPPLAASFSITCLCSQMFISAEPSSAPV